MSTFTEYTQYDATGLAELLKSKEVSPKEVLESAIAQIENTIRVSMPLSTLSLIKYEPKSHLVIQPVLR